MQAIVGRENLPDWERLWDDFVQEETRRGLVQGSHLMTRMWLWQLRERRRRVPRRVGPSSTSSSSQAAPAAATEWAEERLE